MDEYVKEIPIDRSAYRTPRTEEEREAQRGDGGESYLCFQILQLSIYYRSRWPTVIYLYILFNSISRFFFAYKVTFSAGKEKKNKAVLGDRTILKAM